MKSITDYGYIFNPIVVNESYQIIDGQGRFEGLRAHSDEVKEEEEE